MTDRPIPDLAALLNGDEPMSPEAKQMLADAMAQALARGAAGHADGDARAMAAMLEGASSDGERDRMLAALAHDPEALSDLEAAQALLESAKSAPQPRSASRIAAAQAIFENAQPQRLSWLGKLGLGSPRRAIPVFGALAAAAFCAVVIVPAVLTPKAPASGGAPEAGSAFTRKSGGQTSIGGTWSGVAADDGHEGGWSAFALSAPDRRFGAVSGAASEGAAGESAMAACRRAGGTDCAVSASIKGQCLSTAAASPEPPVTKPGLDEASAAKAALTACQDEICRTVSTVCSKP